MTIHARQIALAQKLFSLKNEEYIKYLEQIFAGFEKGDNQELPPLTQDEIDGVKEALEQAKNGELYSEEEIKKKFFNG